VVVCGKCHGEKTRIVKPGGGYRYVCWCEEWKAILKLLDVARTKERKRGR
jgi:hypothetical protein